MRVFPRRRGLPGLWRPRVLTAEAVLMAGTLRFAGAWQSTEGILGR
jgi:hypothetical protein